jgi:hypothetical protein
MAMDKTSKHEGSGKPERRYRLEDEVIPLLDLLNLNCDAPPEDLVAMRDLTIKYIQLLEAREQSGYTPQSRWARPVPEGLPASFGALRTAIENGAIARVKECVCGNYFFSDCQSSGFAAHSAVLVPRWQKSSIGVLRAKGIPRRDRGRSK